jgi:uncharacterized protein (TIGR03066 family)
MRRMAVAVAVALLGAPPPVRGADDNKELIVGVWEITYSDAKVIPVGTKLEFTKDGRLIPLVKVQRDGKEMPPEDGYKIEKDVLTLTGKDGGKSVKGRICLLNASSLVLNDEVEDKVTVLKKVKPK